MEEGTMDITTGQRLATSARETVRLLATVPNLAKPLEVVRGEIHQWASKQGFGAVYSQEQFEAICQRVKDGHTNKTVSFDTKTDFDIARGTLRGLELQPKGGWGEYIEQWTVVRLEHRLKVYRKPEYTRLRTLEERVGGVLLGSTMVPLVLIVPQPTGTYIQMGWDSVVELDRSPFGRDRGNAVTLREHLLPPPERTFTVPAF